MTWKELITNCTKSDNHLILLEALYDKELSLKKFKGVNYKTSCRIINSFIEQGIVTKNKGLYSLTGTGRLIACATLGRFQTVKPEIKVNAIIDPSEVYVERADTIKEVLQYLKLGQSVFVTGESGIGKTAFLKHLINDYLTNALMVRAKPPMNILEGLANHYEISLVRGKRRKRMFELMDDIIKRLSNDLILVIDEVEELTKQSASIIKTLMRNDLIVLIAGTKLKHELKVTEVKLRPLTKDEINTIINDLLSKELPNELKAYLTHSNGNPEWIKDQCKSINIKNEAGELKIKEVIKNDQKPTKRINLLSKDELVNIGFLCLALRYIFYGQKEYQTGYYFAMAAYMLFYLFRRKRKKK